MAVREQENRTQPEVCSRRDGRYKTLVSSGFMYLSNVWYFIQWYNFTILKLKFNEDKGYFQKETKNPDVQKTSNV